MPTYVRDSGAWKPVSGSSLPEGSTFEAGTKLMFAQASAPAGWTRVGGDVEDNRMLRVVSGGGGGNTGGSASPILNNVVPSHTHSFSTGNQSVNHYHGFITGGESDDHSHRYTDPTIGAYIGQRYDETGNTAEYVTGQGGTTSGRSNGHTHSGDTYGISADHQHSGSTDNGSSQTNWSPRYINMILCEKLP